LKKFQLFWPSNEQIRFTTLRVIGPDGKQIGILDKSKALELAKKEGLDLVEISDKANPPVAKIVDYGKFRYQEEKKLREASKKSKPGDLKEVRFSPFIAENDFQTRYKRVKEFLKDKDKVKLVVVFKGRQLGSKPFGYKIFDRMKQDLGEGINVDMLPKFLGRSLVMIISPTNKYGKEKNKETDHQ